MEQLNIEGKRSGEGFVAHKATLVNALTRAIASRVTVNDVTLGRKGFLAYLKALGGSNVVKVIPSKGSASAERATSSGLKVMCGANTSTLTDGEWIGEKTPMTICEVRVSPRNTVIPNVGASELSEALAKVLPFTATDDSRPVLQCVLFEAKEGKLTLVSADGFRLATISLDYQDGEGRALINRDDLKGIANALKRARRARIGFEQSGSLDVSNLIIDTDLIGYKFTSVNGSYPDWAKLIPSEFHVYAHFDTVEAIKATQSLKVLADSKAYPIDLTIGSGKMVMANPDDKGQAEIIAETNGEGKIRVDGSYLASVLKATGGMVELQVTTPSSPMLFSQNGYRVVVMPMMTSEAKEQAKKEKEAEAKTEPASQPQAESREPAKPKEDKASRAKEPVKAK